MGMKFFRTPLLICGLGCLATALLGVAGPPARAAAAASNVVVQRVPGGGIQPQVVVKDGVVHLVYFLGRPAGGDAWYTRSTDSGEQWSSPLRVNSQPGSVTAMGTIRGATLAVGRKGNVYVAWNGSDISLPRNTAAPAAKSKYGAAPLLFSRLGAGEAAFEPQRNLMTSTFDLDGGANVAADDDGTVYVAFHAHSGDAKDETQRRVYLARSTNDGASFSAEEPVDTVGTGACGCCQVGVLAQDGGRVEIAYRSATDLVHRDAWLLQSTNAGAKFIATKLETWNLNACPMSKFGLISTGPGVEVVAWEGDGHLGFARENSTGLSRVVRIDGAGSSVKYPSLAMGPEGELLVAWEQGAAWGRGGKLCSQLFDAQGSPLTGVAESGTSPAWSFPAAVAIPSGKFMILY